MRPVSGTGTPISLAHRRMQRSTAVLCAGTVLEKESDDADELIAEQQRGSRTVQPTGRAQKRVGTDGDHLYVSAAKGLFVAHLLGFNLSMGIVMFPVLLPARVQEVTHRDARNTALNVR